MNQHEKINYIELPCKDFDATKSFFEQVFNWQFKDYGPEYIAFSNAGIEGGFYKSKLKVSTNSGSALIVFFSNDLDSTLSKLMEAGGSLIKPIFDFPGGRRFHFADPSGNEYAVWSDQS